MFKKVIIMLFVIFCPAGCKTITVNSVKPWEGHYKTVEQFKNSTESIELEKGETIWVLSNETLKRVLKNCEK